MHERAARRAPPARAALQQRQARHHRDRRCNGCAAARAVPDRGDDDERGAARVVGRVPIAAQRRAD
eukprot:scaffold139262_cov193-Phaeocystis_antarctica.AAC.1